ncbi:sensor histidine kinase [Rhodococcus sp. IEGM 1379]|uniref:sensor histidine kinase n=1 Tax=Rhodococcus sp. IEGM 1379 TaxID=3047086 RepID=UPI0024B7182A|nr:sensor histidine kinase [Rhodococcus sp. IEGM 1379]MDI9916070.1 sensor histidine kinase [Rhodococcus sp. IEGM 1379]
MGFVRVRRVEELADHVSVSVTDTGVGIPSAELESVFDRFHRGGSSDGSGLGLTVARSLALAHGGTLTATVGSDGTGTTLELRLPIRA